MPRQPADYLDPWRPHEAAIRKLYLIENLSAKKVQQIFEGSPYFLKSSESQFENVLKALQIKKNLSAADWRTIKFQQAARKREGKDTAIYHNGKLMSWKKFCKHTLRNRQHAGPISTTIPAGVLLRTPPSSPGHQNTINKSNYSRTSTGPSNLGILQLNKIPSKICSSMKLDAYCPTPDSSSFLNSNHTNDNGPPQFSPQWPDSVSPYPTCLQFTMDRNELVADLPSFKIWSWLRSCSFPSVAAIGRSLNSSLVDWMEDQGEVNNKLSNRMVTLVSNGDPVEATSLDKSALHRIQIISMLVDLLSNNFVSFNFRLKLAGWIQGERPVSLLRMVFRARDLTATTVIARLLSLATLPGRASILQLFIDNGLDKKYVSGRLGGEYLLKALSHSTVDVRFCQILVAAGAHVNLTDGAKRSALHLLAGGYGDYNLIIACLDKGCPIDALTEAVYPKSDLSQGLEARTALMLAVEAADANSVRALLDRGADISCLETQRYSFKFGYREDKELEVFELLVFRVGFRWTWLVHYGIIFAAKDGLAALQDFDLTAPWSEGDFDREHLLEDALDTTWKYFKLDRRYEQQEAPDDSWERATTALLELVVHENLGTSERLLAAAFEVQAYEVVELLIARGTCIEGFKVLEPILRNDQDTEKICKYLRARFYNPPGFHIDLDCIEGRSLLQEASAEGKFDLVRFLVAEGAAVNGRLTKTEKLDALHLAVEAGHFDLARFLITHKAQINNWLETPAKSLLELCAKAASRKDRQYPCFVAPSQDRQDFLKYLLDIGAELITPGASLDRHWGAALPHVIQYHEVWGDEFIREMIEAGVDLHCHTVLWGYRSMNDESSVMSSFNLSSLQVAALEGSVSIAQQLLFHGARINDPPAIMNGRTALQAALEEDSYSMKDNTRMVQFLLNHGADVNGPALQEGGYMALATAINAGNLENVQLLLEHSVHIDLDSPDRRGRTPLQAACQHLAANPDGASIVKLLLDHGADPNSPAADLKGVTALQGAAASGKIDVVLLLLERGALVDAPGAKEDGRTALEMAAEHGRLDVLQVLINTFRSQGIRPNCDRARVLAAEEGHLGVVELLESVMSAQGVEIPPLPARRIRNWHLGI